MSSNDQMLAPPTKPKMSPLEFRNTDLVSRLLAATPPYLYNMSLLPNTYFFSEMLRSFVQAKNEQNARNHPNVNINQPLRRSRKRAWSMPRHEFAVPEPKPERKYETHEPWMLKSNRKQEENPLELTTSNNNNPESAFHGKIDAPVSSEQLFPNLPHSVGTQDAVAPNLVLPPPPPMWYPPLYPAPPYGIDPLHFFIDLRVSGHIYDRKNQNKESTNTNSTTTTSTVTEEKPENVKNEEESLHYDMFKRRRHCSAFSVPTSIKNTPMNLSERPQTKFDVKSMGFDKNPNKTSTNYVMGNLTNIYRSLEMRRTEDAKVATRECNDETNNEKKRVKDLKALIGLELVVDYVKKPEQRPESVETFSTDVESVGSPALEVVAIQEESC